MSPCAAPCRTEGRLLASFTQDALIRRLRTTDNAIRKARSRL